MLRGIDGGRKSQGSVTAAHVLAEYGDACQREACEETAFGASVALEIIGSFLAQVVARNLPGITIDDEDDERALARVPAREVVRSAGACLRLFPYQAVVGQGVIDALPRHTARLVAFSAARGHATDADVGAFRTHAALAEEPLRRHRALQESLDRVSSSLHAIAAGERVVGRFEVVAVRPAGLDLQVPPTGRSYRVVMPPGLPATFERGHAVSMLLQRMTLDWIPLAAALPERPEALDALLDACWRPQRGRA